MLILHQQLCLNGARGDLGAATFSNLDPDAAQTALETTSGNWLAVRAYDAKPSTAAFPWSLFSTQISPLSLNNVGGRLAATASLSNGAWQAALVSYDADGQIAVKYTFTQANGGGSVWTTVNSTITYTRDLRGALTQRAFTVGSSNWYQWYDYDGRGLLTKLSASTTNSKPASADVTDLYGPSGQVSSFQFPSVPAESIKYNIRGATMQIGRSTAPLVFPFSVDYWYNHNGTVGSQDVYNSASPATNKRFKYLPSYDALDRITKTDDSVWTGTSWAGTMAYALAGITYDASGNIKTLQRYRSDGTLIDNLTYTYASTSNRLTSVSDAVAPTAETWDAESGSFTYDANGNLLTAPAPYSITAATYDPANLPLTLTSAGVTSNYRYDAAGERIVKQVGTGNVQVYLLDGSTTLGVATLSSTGVFDSAYFNLVWEDRVVGRQPATGSRKYYYTDILGSTRAVATSGTITEAYDYDAWGVRMTGRTLAGATKEGFGSKEQDVEDGLDYFGARYYMPALGRWAAVDPAADNMPEWSTYAYVYDNPAGLTDPDGRQAAVYAQRLKEDALSLPRQVVGEVKEAVRNPGEYWSLSAMASRGLNDLKAAGEAIAAPFEFVFSPMTPDEAANPLVTAHAVALGIPASDMKAGQTEAQFSQKAADATIPLVGGLLGARLGADDAAVSPPSIRELSGEPVPRATSGSQPVAPDPAAAGAPHTRIGVEPGRNGAYRQGFTFDKDGKLVSRTDVTDHGRPETHTNPHVHLWQGPNGGWSGQQPVTPSN